MTQSIDRDSSRRDRESAYDWSRLRRTNTDATQSGRPCRFVKRSSRAVTPGNVTTSYRFGDSRLIHNSYALSRRSGESPSSAISSNAYRDTLPCISTVCESANTLGVRLRALRALHPTAVTWFFERGSSNANFRHGRRDGAST